MRKDLNPDAQPTAVLFYDTPREVGRTGHAAVAIILLSGSADEIITPEKLLLFFSVYHNHPPSEVSGSSMKEKILKSFKARTVTSLSEDLIMRGESWKILEDWCLISYSPMPEDEILRCKQGKRILFAKEGNEWFIHFRDKENNYQRRKIEKERDITLLNSEALPECHVVTDKNIKQKLKKILISFEGNIPRENVPVGKLLETLPTDPSIRKESFKRGLCKFHIQIPLSNAQAVESELKRIEKIVNWAMFSSFKRIIGLDSNAYNCCSAIWEALEKDRTNKNQTALISSVPASAKLLFWLGYFAILLFSLVPKPDLKNPLAVIFYAPALCFAMQIMLSLKNAYEYATDMAMMSKDPKNTDLKLLFCVYSTCFLVNAIGSIITSNACFDLFKFPTSLARAARKIPGACDVKLEYDVDKFAAVGVKA